MYIKYLNKSFFQTLFPVPNRQQKIEQKQTHQHREHMITFPTPVFHYYFHRTTLFNSNKLKFRSGGKDIELNVRLGIIRIFFFFPSSSCLVDKSQFSSRCRSFLSFTMSTLKLFEGRPLSFGRAGIRDDFSKRLNGITWV